MGSMLEFITRMGYHFRRKIEAEIVELCKHVGMWTADGAP